LNFEKKDIFIKTSPGFFAFFANIAFSGSFFAKYTGRNK